MAGLGFGSLYWGKRADRGTNPLKIFGFLQVFTGISSLVIMVFFSVLPSMYQSIYQSLHASAGVSLVLVFLISFILLFVPTFLMGGTFPVIAKRYVETGTSIGQGVGLLYAINTFGAIAGVTLTGYFLIGYAGQHSTQLIFVCINLVLGCISLILSKNDTSPYRPVPAEDKQIHPESGISPFVVNASLVAAGVMGFCGLALEILTTRALSVFLTNSIYNFTGILVVFLVGITSGSFLFSKFLNHQKNLLLFLGTFQVLTGFYCILTTAFLNDIPLLLHPFKRNMLEIPLFYFTAPGLILSIALLLVPATCLGIVFPLFCKLFSSRMTNMGSDIGKVYCANTLGCIAGPLVAAFVLIPLIGVSKGLLVIALICIISGGIFLRLEKGLKNKASLYLMGILVAGIGIPCIYSTLTKPRLYPPSLFRTNNRIDSIAYYKETVEGTVVVNKDLRTGICYLYVNNTAVFGITYDAVKVVKMLAHLPFLIEPEAKQVLIIGFGTGITTAEMAKHGIEKIECVEICPGVKEASRFFTAYNNAIVDDPRVTFIDADGRNHLLVSDKKYDVISCDPSHPVLGSGNLYSKEYFILCKEHLTPNGVISQYLPMHMITRKGFDAIIKTFQSVFPYTSVWLGQSHCVLIGAPRPLNIDFASLKDALARLNDNMFNDPYNVASSLLLDDSTARRMTGGAVLYSDDKPFLDYHSFQVVKDEHWHLNLLELMKYQTEPLNHFTNYTSHDRETMARYMIGRELFLHGLIQKNRGYYSLTDLEGAIGLFKKAAQINPENSEISAMLSNELSVYEKAVQR
jgi:spermidine synthase